MRNSLKGLLFLLAIIQYGSEDGRFQLEVLSANREEFAISNLTWEDQPYALEEPISKEITYNVDEFGIPVFSYQGTDYYHPVFIAQKILPLISSYYLTNDYDYLDRAEFYAEKLLDISIDDDDRLFFIYPFSFYLHGYSDELMVAPWVSGMAQGQILSVFSRLYQLTHKNKYLQVAQKIYNSFLKIADKDQYWCTYIDDNNYAWIEEYPDIEEPNHTLNGFIFAIIGLYDYYEIHPSEESKEVLRTFITTIKQYIGEFRNEGGLSYYCLAHRVTNLHYHQVHIDQLNYLFAVTEDSTFYHYARLFSQDHE